MSQQPAPPRPEDELPDPAAEALVGAGPGRALMIAAISLATLLSIGAVAVFWHPLLDALGLGRRDDETLALSPARIRAISEEMRQNSRDRHHRTIVKMEEVLARMEKIRDRKFRELRARDNPPVNLASPPPPIANHDEAPLTVLYKRFRDMEQAVADTYQELRAAKAAQIMGVPMTEALQETRVPLPPRAELDPAIADGVINTARGGLIDKYRHQLRTMADEEDAMLAYAENLLKLAEQMEKAELEGLNVDLASQDRLEVGMTPGATLMPWEMNRSHEMKEGTITALGTRRISLQAAEATWVYPDAWYVIGPFENPGRRNINQQFLPESLVDLDAEYEGKNGQKLRWQYWKLRKPRIVPHPNPGNYEIYYGYTELWFEKEMALWVVLGSDDHGKLWVNDELVWSSALEAKAFKEDEQFQLVKFKAGYNRLLFRLENAGGLMGYSLMINTTPMTE